MTLPPRLVVGTYSVEPAGDAPDAGTGLRVLVLEREPGAAEYVGVGHEVLASPTWVEPHPTRPWLLSVGETDPSEVVCSRLDDDGGLTVLGRCATGGDSACHLSLSGNGRWVVVAHYGSGTVETFALDDEGRLQGPVGRYALSGPTGPDAQRQDRSHAHQVVPDPGRPGELLVCDLGTDRVHRLRLGADGDLSMAAAPILLPAGTGPRHLVVDEDVLLVVAELSWELHVLRRTGGGWRHTAAAPTTTRARAGERGGGAGGAVHVSGPVLASELQLVGDLVVVATRGVDVLTVLALDRRAGTLATVAEVSCGGQHPRDLVVADGLAWVANQWSDEVVALDLAAVVAGREVAPVARVAVSRPARVLVLDRRSGPHEPGGQER